MPQHATHNTPDTRTLAFRLLYQLDAAPPDPGSAEDLLSGLPTDALAADPDSDDRPDDELAPDAASLEAARSLALDAYRNRQSADAFMLELAPDWPPARQAAVDRAILRLAHHEMTATKTPPKVVVNEAVELAKRFSTERSPAFINGLLDKLLKHVLANQQPGAPE